MHARHVQKDSGARTQHTSRYTVGYPSIPQTGLITTHLQVEVHQCCKLLLALPLLRCCCLLPQLSRFCFCLLCCSPLLLLPALCCLRRAECNHFISASKQANKQAEGSVMCVSKKAETKSNTKQEEHSAAEEAPLHLHMMLA
jgi:hypothetical protein